MPRTQRWHQQYSLWPSSNNNTRKPAEGHFLFNCLAKKRQTLIVSLENDGISDKIADKTCIIHPLDGCSGILSVVDKNDSSIYKKLDESYWCKPEKPIKFPWMMKTSLFIVMKISLKIWSTFFIMKAMAKSGPYFVCPKKNRKSNWSWNYCMKEAIVVVQVSKFQKNFF